MIFLVVFAFWASAIDARQRVLPNPLLGAMALSALLCQSFRQFPEVATVWLPWFWTLSASLAPPCACLCLAVATSAVLWLFEMLHRRFFCASGLGAGDVKLAFCWIFALGSWGVAAFAFGCCVGGVVSFLRRQTTFPLGPYVSASALVLALVLTFW